MRPSGLGLPSVRRRVAIQVQGHDLAVRVAGKQCHPVRGEGHGHRQAGLMLARVGFPPGRGALCRLGLRPGRRRPGSRVRPEVRSGSGQVVGGDASADGQGSPVGRQPGRAAVSPGRRDANRGKGDPGAQTRVAQARRADRHRHGLPGAAYGAEGFRRPELRHRREALRDLQRPRIDGVAVDHDHDLRVDGVPELHGGRQERRPGLERRPGERERRCCDQRAHRLRRRCSAHSTKAASTAAGSLDSIATGCSPKDCSSTSSAR